MKAIALIPARYAATRFPGKLLADLKGRSVIRRTYEATLETGLFDDVIVATDSDEILHEITSNGGKVVKTFGNHESGTDRIAEAATQLDADVIVNVQGDTPFIKKEPLRKLLEAMQEENVRVASLMQEIYVENFISDPNYVKVCTDLKMNALFFSRSVIPYLRNKSAAVKHYEHIGVYAFTRQALIDFTRWPVSPLEDAEKIECLRFLENGVSIRMVVTDFMGVEIDTPEDMEKAASLL